MYIIMFKMANVRWAYLYNIIVDKLLRNFVRITTLKIFKLSINKY